MLNPYCRSKSNTKKATTPDCNCFPVDQAPPEPGPLYTHLGTAKNLNELRTNIEKMSGFLGTEIRIEKVLFSSND